MKTIITLMTATLIAASGLNADPIKVGDTLHVNGMLASIAAGDYKTFLSHGTPELASNVSEKKFTEMVTRLRPILVGGYHLTSTGSTEKSLEDIVLTWKLFYDSSKPNLFFRVDAAGSAGSVKNFQFE